MENQENKYAHINGWGIDADDTNEPTHPMKKYTGDDHNRINWERPTLQPENIEKLHSNERPYMTAVFGTTVPPSGISGAMRRYAFKYSEGRWTHWLTLLMADRVNVVEAIVDDISKGTFPNIWKEKGYNAAWKHNRKGLIANLAITALVATAVVLWLKSDDDDD